MIFCRVPFHDRGSRGQQRRVAGTPCADNVEQQVPRNGPPPPLVLHRRSAARSPYAVAFFPRHAAHTSHRPAAGSPASLFTRRQRSTTPASSVVNRPSAAAWIKWRPTNRRAIGLVDVDAPFVGQRSTSSLYILPSCWQTSVSSSYRLVSQ